MTWLSRTRRSGFTLIEILIALVVLFIGIVGIIALFPIGIESTKASVQDTNAALIAESIHHAIIVAMRNPVGSVAYIVHDGVSQADVPGAPPKAGGYAPVPAYSLALAGGPAPTPTLTPAAESDTDHHPRGDVTYPSGGSSRIFQLCREELNITTANQDPVVQAVEDIRGAQITQLPSATLATDPSIDYSQYFWDFWVQQVADAAGAGLPLYQFRIRIWRNYPGGDVWNAVPTPREVIQEFRVLVASNT